MRKSNSSDKFTPLLKCQSQQSLINKLCTQKTQPDIQNFYEIHLKMKSIIDLCLDENKKWRKKYETIGEAQLHILETFLQNIRNHNPEAAPFQTQITSQKLSEKLMQLTRSKSMNFKLDAIQEEPQHEKSDYLIKSKNLQQKLIHEIEELRAERVKIMRLLNEQIKNHNQAKKEIAQLKNQIENMKRLYSYQSPLKKIGENNMMTQPQKIESKSYAVKASSSQNYIPAIRRYNRVNTAEGHKKQTDTLNKNRTAKKNFSWNLSPQQKIFTHTSPKIMTMKDPHSISKSSNKVKFDSVPVVHDRGTISSISSGGPATSIKTILEQKKERKQKLQQEVEYLLAN